MEEISLSISGQNHFLKEFHKLKVSSDSSIQDYLRIKLSKIDQDELLIAVPKQKKFGIFSLHYYIFAYLIQQKLLNMGLKLQKVVEPSIPGIP